MRWLVKAATQNVLSALPRADSANYWFQRHITRSLPRSDDGFAQHVGEALRHLDTFERLGRGSRDAAAFYEFGAGWDLIGPMTYWACGVEQQILVDIRSNLRLELVADTLRRLFPVLAARGRAPTRQLPEREPTDIPDLRRFGITYLAPRDARDTRLDSDSVDFISSTFTLEHIPPRDLVAILRESRRLLRSGGLTSSVIDFKDHYSYVDPSIGPHNFLRFSDRTWRLVDSSLHFQNRLRLPDYLDLFQTAGLRLVEADVVSATQDERERVKAMSLAPRFASGYSIEDLTAESAHLVATRADQ